MTDIPELRILTAAAFDRENLSPAARIVAWDSALERMEYALGIYRMLAGTMTPFWPQR